MSRVMEAMCARYDVTTLSVAAPAAFCLRLAFIFDLPCFCNAKRVVIGRRYAYATSEYVQKSHRANWVATALDGSARNEAGGPSWGWRAHCGIKNREGRSQEKSIVGSRPHETDMSADA
ncbi:hypothetical protein C8R45DRAFT_944251 [Mycena sanguinolenta]|nr:hypothetical protein C8R45DRAFT_944251 [Mycena sanguinolenta]